jgi:hypothetical protein
MKKVVFSILAATLVFVSCKNESSQSQTDQAVNDLALADTTVAETDPEFLYVTAYNGLTLREFNNLNSEKLAKMPYGTKVKILNTEKNLTMDVAGIKGGMNEVEFNQKKGYAFNGYLSKFFPPEKDSKAKIYAEELKAFFPAVVYSESVGGTASRPENTETLVLPTTQWHEAFFVAQRLFDFPKEFDFPNPKGKDQEVIKDSKPKKDIWTSELHIDRSEDELQKIEYVYTTKGFGKTVTITKDGNTMKIDKTEIVE